MALPADGATVREKLEGGIMVSGVLEAPLWAPTVTVIGPVAAPAGTVKERVLFVGFETGGANVPPL